MQTEQKGSISISLGHFEAFVAVCLHRQVISYHPTPEEIAQATTYLPFVTDERDTTRAVLSGTTFTQHVMESQLDLKTSRRFIALLQILAAQIAQFTYPISYSVLFLYRNDENYQAVVDKYDEIDTQRLLELEQALHFLETVFSLETLQMSLTGIQNVSEFISAMELLNSALRRQRSSFENVWKKIHQEKDEELKITLMNAHCYQALQTVVTKFRSLNLR